MKPRSIDKGREKYSGLGVFHKLLTRERMRIYRGTLLQCCQVH
jgi:hypothetical protein